MNEEISGPKPEDIDFNAETEKSSEGEPTIDEYLNALEDWKEQLDEETFLSLQEEFETDIDSGIGYLFTVAAENGLDAEELLIKHGLVRG